MTRAPHTGAGGGLFSNAYLLLVLTTLFWAGNSVAGKFAAGSIPPLTLTAIRWVFTAAILYILARPHLEEAWPVLRARWRYLFALGSIGFAMFNFAFYAALNYTTAINVAIEQSGMPMVIILASYLIYREPVTRLQLAGVAVTIVGVLVTATHGDIGTLVRLEMNIGDAIMMIAVLAYSAYSVALRHKPKIPWQPFMFALALSAAIAALPGLAFDLAAGRLPAAAWVTPAVLLYVIIFPSLLAQIFYMRAIELIGANRASLFINLVPVFATALAVTLLGEQFRTYQMLGLGLVISGIAMAEFSARRRTARAFPGN